MRILLVVRDMHPRGGGPPRVMVGSALALAGQGHQVTIAAEFDPGEEAQVRTAWRDLDAAGVKLELFPASGRLPINGTPAIAKMFNARIAEWDVVHLHGVWDRPLIAAGNAARRAKVPYLISPHGMLDRWSFGRQPLKKWFALHILGAHRLLYGATAIVFGTQDEAEEASLTGPWRTEIVPNGVPETMLAPRDPGARQKLHEALPQSRDWTRILLFYARFHPKKGLDMLIEAFSQVAPDHPGTALLAAGIPEDAEYEKTLHAQTAASPVAGRIVLTSQFAGPEARFLLDAADILALPSHQEGFSMAVIEGMARGLPVLITTRCHFPEVEAEGAGRVVAATPEALAEGLLDLLAKDDAALRTMGDAGAKLVADRFTWTQVARQLGDAYARAVG